MLCQTFKLALPFRKLATRISSYFIRQQPNMASSTNGVVHETTILQIPQGFLGNFADESTLEHWKLPEDEANLVPLREAARLLKTSNIPVGFPTETVYGLGADATRSEAVKGIYKAKGRPSDNPLIIHVADLAMLRSLLTTSTSKSTDTEDVIPEIYKPLIKKFWPGPLTILLPNPTPSKLAPEVTAGLPTFGVRMPSSALAQSLIQLTGVPLAAPSANASTKPSPTTAQHVKHDLDGRIELIIDGGACQVGVESTVVDGMCSPPVVLRPGGISIDRIRECPGWRDVDKGYKDASEIGPHAPRAPGMKYKHYSPKAKVVLFEANKYHNEGIPLEVFRIIQNHEQQTEFEALRIGIISTKYWRNWGGFHDAKWALEGRDAKTIVKPTSEPAPVDSYTVQAGELYYEKGLSHDWDTHGEPFIGEVIEIALGKKITDIAHGLFSALRELDQRGVDVIYVEGIEDDSEDGDIAAAVMNRLRKAASQIEM